MSKILEFPTSHENDQSPEKIIYDGFAELLVLRGEIDEEPMDKSFPSGRDGTENSEHSRVRSFTLDLDSKSLPTSLLDKSIKHLHIRYSPSVVLDYKPTNDTLYIILDETTGVEKCISFELDDDGSIKTLSDLSMTDEISPKETIEPVNIEDFARDYAAFNNSPANIDDINLLLVLLNELNTKYKL